MFHCEVCEDRFETEVGLLRHMVPYGLRLRSPDDLGGEGEEETRSGCCRGAARSKREAVPEADTG